MSLSKLVNFYFLRELSEVINFYFLWNHEKICGVLIILGEIVVIFLNPLNASVALNRNQINWLLCKSIDWFLYKAETGI